MGRTRSAQAVKIACAKPIREPGPPPVNDDSGLQPGYLGYAAGGSRPRSPGYRSRPAFPMNRANSNDEPSDDITYVIPRQSPNTHSNTRTGVGKRPAPYPRSAPVQPFFPHRGIGQQGGHIREAGQRKRSGLSSTACRKRNPVREAACSDWRWASHGLDKGLFSGAGQPGGRWGMQEHAWPVMRQGAASGVRAIGPVRIADGEASPPAERPHLSTSISVEG